jgi:hypothetical protein
MQLCEEGIPLRSVTDRFLNTVNNQYLQPFCVDVVQ